MALEIVRNDDFIEYFLFPQINSESETQEDGLLDGILKQVNDIASSYTSSFIWHKDPFALKARNSSSHLLNPEGEGGESLHNNPWIMLINSLLVDKLPPHLYGITYFGDNIQDEWFVVSLLFHLTREIAGLIVRACDSDGEFLLIEAADHLPQWANPETCEQRVSLVVIFRFVMGLIRRLWHD